MLSFLSFLLPIAGVILYAAILQDSWGWFITPEFGIAAPAFWVCAGIAYMFRVFTKRASRNEVESLLEGSDSSDYLTFVTVFFNQIFSPLFNWFVLWIIYCIAY